MSGSVPAAIGRTGARAQCPERPRGIGNEIQQCVIRTRAFHLPSDPACDLGDRDFFHPSS